MNWLTATVAIRPLAILAGRTAPATSTWAMIQPPKMSPLPLASAGIGMTRITSWRSFGRVRGAIDEMSGAWSISGIFGRSRSWPPILSSIDPSLTLIHAPCHAVPARAHSHRQPGREAAEVRLAHARQAPSLRLAVALAGGSGAGLPGRRQARQHRRAAGPEEPGRRALAQARRPAQRHRRAGGDPDRLRRVAAVDHALHGAARVPLLSGSGAHRPARLARGLRAPAAAEPALSPRAADRRRVARHRAWLALDP